MKSAGWNRWDGPVGKFAKVLLMVTGSFFMLIIVIFVLPMMRQTQTNSDDSATEETQVVEDDEYCQVIIAKDTDSMVAAQAFCLMLVPAIEAGFMIEGLGAGGPLLDIRVGKDVADGFLADKLMGKQIVLDWMKAWKSLGEWSSVVVTIYWKDVKIVEGDTTVLNGDVVTYFDN